MKRRPKFSLLRKAHLVAGGLLLQAGTCTFDSEALITEGLVAWYNTVAAFLVTSAVSDLLDVTPSFSF